MSNLTIFQFESQEVRCVGTADDPWWVAADVCAVLEIRNSRDALVRLDEDEKGVGIIDTLGGKQEMTIINESGMYSLVLTSRKPQAKRFKKWVTSEVLPSIRKTGKYELPLAEQQSPQPQEPQLALPPVVPTPEEIALVANLIYGNTSLDSNLKATAIGNAIARQHPKYAVTVEIVNSTLSTPIESKLVRPTVLAEKLSETSHEKWTAIRVNKLLLDQGFQIKNPDGKNPAYLPTEKGKEYGQLVLDTARGRVEEGRSTKAAMLKDQYIRGFRPLLN